MQNLEITKNDNENNKENNIVSITHVSLREFILFKEEFLKSLGEFKKEINANIIKEKQKYDLFLENASKIISSQNNSNIFLSKINFIEEKNEIISYIKKIETNFNNQNMVNKISISTCQKDLSDACFKYDKIISDNLLIPGLIGTCCKFPNLKDYILSNKEELSLNSFETKKNELELKEYKNRLENIYEQLKYQIMTIKNNLHAYMELKINEINDKFEDFINKIKEKNLHLKNSGIIENLKVNEEKLINEEILQQLKDENVENNNTINLINKNNKYLINQFVQVKNEFKSLKKNIIDLSMLLTKKDNDKHKKTKEDIINSFNDMMSNLIKETFIKEKKNEFNYNNFNSYNINNNNFPNLIISNNDNNKYSNGLNKLKNYKQLLRLKTQTENKINNALKGNKRRKSLKIMLSDYDNKETLKSKISKDINNNKINNDNSNDSFIELIKRRSPNINKNSFIFGDIKTEGNLNKLIISSKKDLSIIKNEENKKHKEEKLDKLNLEKDKTDIEKPIHNKIELIKENEINIINLKENKNKNTIEKSEKFEIKKIQKKESLKTSDNEQKTILIDEEKVNNDEESFSENEKTNTNLKDVSHPIEKNNHLSNEKPKNNSNYLETYSNSKSIINSIENNKIKNTEKTKSFLNQNKQLNNQNNIKIINDYNLKNMKKINIQIKKDKRADILNFNNDKRCQTFKKNNISVTKNIFSLYNYLRSSRQQKKFKNNKTEDIDSSNFKIKEKSNSIYPKNISQSFCNKELLDKINIIKDEEIIDKPLLCNQENFEVQKCAGDIEKKLLHLEFFMKKKFDELVKEIKIFIPIHFNSYTRDYKVIEK